MRLAVEVASRAEQVALVHLRVEQSFGVLERGGIGVVVRQAGDPAVASKEFIGAAAAPTLGLALGVEAPALALRAFDAVVPVEAHLVSLDAFGRAPLVLARLDEAFAFVDVLVLGECNFGIVFRFVLLDFDLGALRLAIGHLLRIVLLARATRGLDGVAGATNPLVDLLLLLLHGGHAAMARPPRVVAQDVLLGAGAVIGLEDGP